MTVPNRHKWSAWTSSNTLRLAGLLCLMLYLGGCDTSYDSTSPASTKATGAADNPHPDSRTVTKNAVRTQVSGLVLAPRVHTLSSGAIDAMERSDNLLVFPKSTDTALTTRQPGDVLVANRDGGFWRYIEKVEQREHEVLFWTRKANLTEVIHEGTITIETVAPDSHGDLRTRKQGLGASETGSFALDRDFSQSTAMQVAQGGVTLDAHGSLHIRPGYKLEISVGSGSLVDMEFMLFGDLALDAQFQMGVNDGAAPGEVPSQTVFRNVELCGSDATNGAFRCEDGRPVISASILGRDFRISPRLEAGYAWSGRGSGSFKAGFTGSGYLKAGYKFSLTDGATPVGETRFQASAIDPSPSGEVDAELRAELKLGVDVTAGGDPLLEAQLFRGLLTTGAAVQPPSCSLESSLRVRGEVTRHGMAGSGSWELYDETPIDLQHDLTQIPGCTSDSAQDAERCGGGSGQSCPGNMICAPGNFCVEDTPMRVALRWTKGADLDLHVEDPSGRRLGEGRPQGANNDGTRSRDGWIAFRSCGDCPSSSVNPPYGEIAVIEDLTQHGKYQFWVTNESDLGGADESVSYRLVIYDQNGGEEQVEGVLQGTVGAPSVRFEYRAAEPPQP